MTVGWGRQPSGSGGSSAPTAIAVVALVVALTGGGALALQGKNTVDSGDIKNRQVKAKDLARQALKAEAPNNVKPNPQTPSDPCTSARTGVFCGNFDGGNTDGFWSNVPEEDLTGDKIGPAAYFADPGGVVHLSGVVTPNSFQTTLVAFVLPPRYRPAATRIFPAPCDVNFSDFVCQVYVRANGEVRRFSQHGQSGGVSLDGISFLPKG